MIFSEKLLELRIGQFNKKQISENTFYDRGVHDVLAYLNYIKVKYDDLLTKKAEKIKYDKVFILPPWKDVYRQDEIRYESFNESVKIHDEIVKIYNFFKMKIIILKTGTIDQRIENILEFINK